jgi:hypothetical protein
MDFVARWLRRTGASFWHVDGAKGEKGFAFEIHQFSAEADCGVSKIHKAAHSGSVSF